MRRDAGGGGEMRAKMSPARSRGLSSAPAPRPFPAGSPAAALGAGRGGSPVRGSGPPLSPRRQTGRPRRKPPGLRGSRRLPRGGSGAAPRRGRGAAGAGGGRGEPALSLPRGGASLSASAAWVALVRGARPPARRVRVTACGPGGPGAAGRAPRRDALAAGWGENAEQLPGFRKR